MIKEHRQILFWSLELLILAGLLWVGSQLQFVLEPIITFVSAVFVPLIISVFLYYMLSPLMNLIMKLRIGPFKIPRSLASLFIVLLLILLVVGGISALIPSVINEFNQLIQWLPGAAKQGQELINQWSHYKWVKQIDLSAYYDQINQYLTRFAKQAVTTLSSSAGSIIGTITSTVIITITVPVMLFYMLKDSPKLVPSIQKIFSPQRSQEVSDLLHQMNRTLSSYISGQAIECLFVAIATSIGYLIINQPLAIVLGVIAGIANMVPYVGPYIGIAPPLLVSIAIAPNKIIWVIVVVVIVQQIDGNIIYPNIIGRSLKIHPLTIIVLLLAAGNIAGIPGMILCIPFYAVIRTVVIYFWNIWQLQSEKQE